VKHILLFVTLYASVSLANPLVVAVLMVKNEAPVMQTTLQPLINAGIKDYFIYDTGSTDNTIQVTKDFFKKNKITNFKITQEPWIDFATSRNKALQLTEQAYPNATFMLMLDAEWILHGGSELLKICLQEKNDPAKLYAFHIIQTNNDGIKDHIMGRLMRTHSNVSFIGRVHEIPNIDAAKIFPSHIYFEYAPSKLGKKNSETRWKTDCQILLEEFKANPKDTRNILLLGQTYGSLKDWPNAAKWYSLRANMIDKTENTEEKFVAFFALGQVYQMMGDYEKMIVNYLKAFNIDPKRAEPLIRLAIHYFKQGNHSLACVFIKHAITIDYPTHTASVIEKELYEFVRYDLLARVAWSQNEFELGRYAAQMALNIKPDAPSMQDILQYYQAKLKEQR
jgi:tetratricopeptide (TPR) repeat protein